MKWIMIAKLIIEFLELISDKEPSPGEIVSLIDKLSAEQDVTGRIKKYEAHNKA